VKRIPIACSLSTSDASERISEWRAFLEKDVVETDRTTALVRLRLTDEVDSVLSAIDLAQREKACCAFFEFRLAILSESVWLEISIPDDAGVTLDELSFLI
jgi:hypothetical protein